MQDPIYRVVPDGLIHDTIEGETILLNVKSGTYYNLYGAATDIWEMLAIGGRISDFCRLLEDHYSAQPGMSDDVRTFVLALETHGLILAVEGDLASEPSARLDSPLKSWQVPAMTSYNDLQDLLTIDPIHDVDDSGWPNARPG